MVSSRFFVSEGGFVFCDLIFFWTGNKKDKDFFYV